MKLIGWGGGKESEVVVNLHNLQEFSYEPTTTLAKLGGGLNLGQATTLLQEAGSRAVPHGACPSVGVGGHGVVGGFGITSRLYGGTIDHVESAQMVLANGTVATVSEATNPDLLFALKGAGASYGIVTEYTFTTVPSPPKSVFFQYTFAGGNSSSRAKVVTEFQKYVSNPALERAFNPVFTVVPGAILCLGAYFGTLEQYNALNFASAFSTPPSATNVTEVDDWLALSGIFAAGTASGQVPQYLYAKNLYVKPESLIPASTIETLLTYVDTTPSGALSWLFEIQLEGGAINDVAQDATAYAHRDTLYFSLIEAVTNGTVTNTTYKFIDGAYNIITSGQPNVSFPAYAGYVDTRLKDAPQQYWTSNLPKLEKIKAAVDPRDVFHNPQSVPLKKKW